MIDKILAAKDALGSLIEFRPLPGQAHDLRGTASPIEELSCGNLLADRACDAYWLRKALSAVKIKAVIPPKLNRRLRPRNLQMAASYQKPLLTDRGIKRNRTPLF